MTTAETLRRLSACETAIEWVEARPDKCAYDLWRSCSNGAWLLWIAAALGVNRRIVVAATCACVREAFTSIPLSHMEYPRTAIETAEAWCRGEWVSTDAVHRAAKEAGKTADILGREVERYGKVANEAAHAAVCAACCAVIGANGDAALLASFAVNYADTAVESADIVRRMISWNLVREALDTWHGR